MSLEVEVKHTKMTRFLCQELLYEYVSGKLDPRRKADMDAYIPTCRESQRELERLKRGLSYTGKAMNLTVAPPLHNALVEFEPAWQKRLREWTLWSSQRGWKMLPYVFVIATVGAGIAALKPWTNFSRNEVTLAEQAKVETQNPPPVDASVPPPAPPTESVPGIVPTLSAPQEAPALVVKAEPKPTIQEAEDARIENPVGSTGAVHNATISVRNFTDVWPLIKDKVVALGGRPAGSVELGWLRKPEESYFHFSLPESNQDALVEFLGTFGPVRFNIEKHSRVMPEGQIRIILVVKDADPAQAVDSGAEQQDDEAPTETP